MVYNFGGGLCSGYAGNPYFNGCLDSKSFGAASFVLVLESLTKVRERKHHFLPSTMAGNAGHFLVLVQVAMQTILLSIILFLIPCVWLMFASRLKVCH